MSYNKITLYGGCQYNYLLVAERELTTVETTEIFDMTTPPQWNTIEGDVFYIMANFEGNLKSSYISGITENVTAWNIYREEVGAGKSEFVGKVESDIFTIVDIMAGSQRSYIYHVYPETQNMIGLAMTSEIVTMDHQWNYSLASIKEDESGVCVANEIWNFSLNVETGASEQAMSINIFETLSKFDKISRGNKDYLTFTLTCLLGDVSPATEKYDSNINKLNAWRKFISSSDKYIWKDRLGDVRIVSLASNPTMQYVDETSEQAQKISFTVNEISDIEDFKNGIVGLIDYENGTEVFVYTNTESELIWEIPHTLFKKPTIRVFDEYGNIICPVSISYPDLTTVVIVLPVSSKGKAFLS